MFGRRHLYNPQTGASYCGLDGPTTTVRNLSTCPVCHQTRLDEAIFENVRREFVPIAQQLMHEDPEWAVTMMHISQLYEPGEDRWSL